MGAKGIKRWVSGLRRLARGRGGYTPMEYALLAWGIAVFIGATMFAVLGDVATAFHKAMTFG